MENYSEDYKKLLEYKQNENSEEIQLKTVSFFLHKYSELWEIYYKKYVRLSCYGADFEGTVDFEEMDNYSVIYPKKIDFYRALLIKYVPQALKSFNPEKIITKETYSFSTYLYRYLSHAVRDLTHKWIKNMSEPVEEAKTASFEEKFFIDQENELIKKSIQRLKKKLSPLENQILDELMSGKKQVQIVIVNTRTGKKYSKGYVSKKVKKIRLMMKKLMEA